MGLTSLAVGTWLAIFGGQPAQVCETPSAVALTGDFFCSGALVTPELVVFAAHCGHPDEIVLGEDIFGRSIQIPVLYCETNPLVDGEPGGADFAYCVLTAPAPVPTPPPVIRGCEVDALEEGAEVLIAGFGHTLTTGPYSKYVATTTLSAVELPALVFAGDMNTGTCAGDSGGPMYIRLADGSWRLAGILTGSVGKDGDADCGGTSAYMIADRLAPLIESLSNLDLSPCHDETGQWQPTPNCEAPVELIGGSWGSACAGQTMAPQTCGPPATVPTNGEPWVSIVEPDDGATILFGLELALVAEAGDSYPGGIKQVSLLVDGEVVLDPHGQSADQVAPFGRYGLALEAGVHTLTARAEGWDSAVADVSVEIFVDDSAGSTGATETDGPAADGETSSCACTEGPPAPGWLWACSIVVGLRRRRVSLPGEAGAPRRRTASPRSSSSGWPCAGWAPTASRARRPSSRG